MVEDVTITLPLKVRHQPPSDAALDPTIKTHILCSITFFPEKKRAVYMIMWKNMVEIKGHRRQYAACALHD